jgi:antitoxin component of RelBE/YafQ-DinJ toxin-antitoxin module
MSRMSDLQLSILEDIEAGELTFEQIAAKYEVPLDWVESANEEYALQLAEADYDGQPDEAQEWYDFDPDC